MKRYQSGKMLLPALLLALTLLFSNGGALAADDFWLVMLTSGDVQT